MLYKYSIMSLFSWVDADLDGAGANLALSWVFGKQIPVRATTPKKFRSDFSGWYIQNQHKYSTIFICDIDVSNHLDIVDKKNIVIIDHHESHLLNKSKYQFAKALVKPHTSCTKLKIDTYKEKTKLMKEQQLLVNLIDDYDSYTLKYPFTLDLNKLFWGFTGDRIQKMYDSFYNGFKGFNAQQKSIINIYNRRLQQTIAELDIHIGEINITGQKRKIVSTIADFAINDVAKTIIDMYDADIGIVVNTNSGSVSFRRSDKCTLSMSELAKKIANGGGHASAAGGTITDIFLNFTKSLNKL